MAGYQAISAVGDALARHLRRAWELSGPGATACDFQVKGCAEMKALKDDSATCALFLYRVTHNEHTRNQPPPPVLGRPVAVDLHYQFSVWHSSALHEQLVLGWLVRELANRPVLDAALLGSGGGFLAEERLQCVAAELSLDDTSKLWQMLGASYRPSLTYVVRNVLIAPEQPQAFGPVVATRLAYGSAESVLAGEGA
jgi:hypothetical protein